MDHRILHGLDPALAKKVAVQAFEAYKDRFPQYHPVLDWTTETKGAISFGVKGLKLHGTLELAPGAILLDMDVPFVFRIFKKQALDVIEREVQTWLQKAKDGLISA